MDTQSEIDFLRAKIRDYLVNVLEQGAMTLEQASPIAQAALDLLPDGATQEQLEKALVELETKFPEHYAAFHAAKLEYDSDQARATIDQTVLADIAAGNLDAALDKLNKTELK